MPNPVRQNPWVRAALVLSAFVGVCIAAYVLSPVLIPLLTAFFVAYIFDPLVDRFEARGHSRGKIIAVLAVIGIFLLVTIPPVAVISIKNQAQTLIQPPDIDDAGIGDKVLDRLEVWIGLDEFVEMMGWEETEVASAEPAAVATAAETDTADEQGVMRGDLQLRKSLLYRAEYGKITTSRAPGGFYIVPIIGQFDVFFSFGHG